MDGEYTIWAQAASRGSTPTDVRFAVSKNGNIAVESITHSNVSEFIHYGPAVTTEDLLNVDNITASVRAYTSGTDVATLDGSESDTYLEVTRVD